MARLAFLGVVFIAAQTLVPHFVRAEEMRGGILAYYAIPDLFLFLWLVFSVSVVVAFLIRDGSTISVFACVGYAFILAVACTFVLLPRVLPHGSSGPGP